MSDKPSNRVNEGSLPPHEAYAVAYEVQRASGGQHLSFTPPREAIYQFFDTRISKSAIKEWDDQNCVIGKYCIVNLEPDDIIDVWLCNPKDIYAGLGQRAVRNRLQAFSGYSTSAVSELDGEAWVKTRDKQLVLDNLKLLGIRKRAERTPETRKAMLKNLKVEVKS